MDFQITSDKSNALIRGDFTFSDHAAFKQMVGSLMESESPAITLDLSNLSFIDSAGLGMLLLVREEAGKSHRKLVLKSPVGQVKRMFGVAKFDTLFVVEA
jgi:anti-anti-sigma factor